MRISWKELLAIIQLLIAVLCIAGLVCIHLFSSIIVALDVLALLCGLAGSALVLIFYSLGTWFYNSNFRRPRRQIRVHATLVILIFFGLIIAGSAMIIVQALLAGCIGFSIGALLLILLVMRFGLIIRDYRRESKRKKRRNKVHKTKRKDEKQRKGKKRNKKKQRKKKGTKSKVH